MNSAILWAACSVLILATISGAARTYNLEQKENVRHVFAAGDNTLDVDLVNGAIAVIGDTGNTIRVEGEKIMRAADQAAMDLAKRDEVLDMNEKSGIAQVYANGPYRDGHNGRFGNSDNHGFHDHPDRNYEVAWNLTIHVPRATILHLRNVNGAIKDENTAGKFDLKTVNGAITMTDIAGSGSANTVNGAATLTFRESPKANSDFKTLNGRIDVTLPPNLAADLKLKTFNGSAYTDFETSPLTTPTEPGERKNGKFVYRTNRASTVRVGAGGPELSFETMNGDIRIHKQGN